MKFVSSALSLSLSLRRNRARRLSKERSKETHNCCDKGLTLVVVVVAFVRKLMNERAEIIIVAAVAAFEIDLRAKSESKSKSKASETTLRNHCVDD